MDKKMLDLYSDYLISSFSYTTATGLSNLLNNSISHDKVTRFLSESNLSGKEWWLMVKPIVRNIQSKEGVLIVDDSIQEKPYTDENDIICWHYDHCKGRQVKGTNFLTTLYHSNNFSIPVECRLIAKTEKYIDKKTGKEKRKSHATKNEYFRQMVRQAKENEIPFKYVLNDVWFASAENMMFVKADLKKDFVMPLKSNRNIALSEELKKKGEYVGLESLELEKNASVKIYLEGVNFPLKLAKKVFKNKDDSIGILYLVTSDLKLEYEEIFEIYKKRWKIEEYHESIKGNACLAKSPTKTVKTQTNHFFASLWAYVKLETLKMSKSLNHQTLRMKLYITATRSAFQELQSIKSLDFA